jgi:hypothetical protein
VSIAFAREHLAGVMPDIAPLLQLHYQELTRNKDRVKLDPQWDKYEQIEASAPDALQVFTARQARALVGYAAFFVHAHPHYRELVVAANDVIFVHPDLRGSAGVRLIRFCERSLAATAHKVLWHVKPGTAMQSLLAHQHMGYELEELMYGKFLRGA